MMSATHLTQSNIDLLSATAESVKSIRFSGSGAPVELPVEEIYSYFLAQKLTGNEIGRFIVDGMLRHHPETDTTAIMPMRNGKNDHQMSSVGNIAEKWAQKAVGFLGQCAHNDGFDTSNPTTVALLRYSLIERPALFSTEQDRSMAADLLAEIPEEHLQILNTLLENAANMSVPLLARTRNTAKGCH